MNTRTQRLVTHARRHAYTQNEQYGVDYSTEFEQALVEAAVFDAVNGLRALGATIPNDVAIQVMQAYRTQTTAEPIA